MAKTVSPGVLALRKVVDDVYADARKAKAEGKLVGWSSSKFPCELAEAFDLNVMYPENQAAGIAAQRDGEIMCKAAEELGFDNDATTMELGELYATQLNITHLVAYEIPRTTSLTLHSQYNPVIESASTEFLLHSDVVECQLDATYAEDGELTFEIDAESCRLRGDDMEYSLLFDYGCEDKTTLTIKAAGSQEVTVTYRNGNVVIQSDTAFTLRQFAPGSDETERFYDFLAGRTVITSSTVEGVTWK